MKDWNSIAKAAAPDIPGKDVSAIAPPLNALEEVFRPLVKSLTPEMEPAALFRAEPEQA